MAIKPMKHVVLPTGQPLQWYLDQEIRLAQDVQEELFFCWVVEPTVIYGRHQDMQAEVNIDYCRARDIKVVQRKSGGG